MIIRAILFIHLWSLFVAFGAWALQRDKRQEIGTRFPPPAVWLTLIVLCLLPGALSLLPLAAPKGLPILGLLEALPNAAAFEPAAGDPLLNFPTVYAGFALFLMSRTLFFWARLQGLKLKPTPDAKIFTTRADVPPLTLSWPRRVIVIPEGFESQTALIRHEQAHLSHYDAEITLGLLLLRDLLLRSPAIGYLVQQWRLAIELRADRAAIQKLAIYERKAYAELLLRGLQPAGNHRDGRTLPCPTAHLTSTRHRSVKMRLSKIMNTKQRLRKRRWYAALPLMGAAGCALGFLGVNSAAKDNGTKFLADKIIYAERVPPKMPKTCPGLDLQSVKIQGREIDVGGSMSYVHTALVGSVVLKFDARPDGSTHNLRVVTSSHACFEPQAKAAVAQWMTEPQEDYIRDVGVMLKFMLTGDETHADLERQLNAFVK